MDARVDVETSVGLAVKRTASALRAAMEAALQPWSLTVPQYACLEQLGQRPGLSGAELARSVFVTRQSMHALLRGLEDRGLLVRPPTAPHGRALPTALTDAGRDALAGASRAVAAVEQAMLAGFDHDGLHRLRRDLAACTAALEATHG